MKTTTSTVNHIARARSPRLRFLRECLAVTLSALIVVMPAQVYAGPTGGTVVGGNADINVNGNTTTINQGSDKAIINWQQFGIGADELVRFNQPGSAAVILNRVTGGDASKILGALQANGRVFLLNPNGILFGSGARVDVAGLMATTLNIRDEDFMAGNYNFAQDPAAQLAYVVNHGRITVAPNGFAYLVAPGVENTGIIVAKGGQVALASGKQAYIDFTGDDLVKFQVSGKITEKVIGPDGEPMSTAVLNTGTVQAAGGHVLLSADTARDIVTSVVNNTGVIEALSLADLVGSVQIEGRGEGDIYNTGLVNVSSDDAGTDAGSVTITGENIANFGAITADAAAQGDAGSIDVRATNAVVVGSDAVITANAAAQGDGGEILLVGEDLIRVGSGATIQARGGSLAGDGGFVETSGHNSIEVNAAPDVSAAAGLAGTWLLDPANIEIKNNSSTNITIDDSVAGVFTSTANISILDLGLLRSALGTGNVTITTGDYGTEAGNITLTDALNYTGGATTLTLNAHNNIILNAAITSSMAALNLNLNAASNAGGGTANVNGSIFLNSSITLNGGAFTTTGNNLTQAAASTISTSGGAFTLGNTGAISLLGAINTANGAFTVANAGGFSYANALNTGSGDISITTAGGINVAQNITSTGAVSLTAVTGSIAGPATVTAGSLNLATLDTENTSIGSITKSVDGGGNEIEVITALKIATGTLSASSVSGVNSDGTTTGNIILENTGATTLYVDAITTNGDKSDTDFANVHLTTDGTLAGLGAGAHIDALNANIRAAHDIILNTNLATLNIGTTDTGGIAINNLSTTDFFIVAATAREYGNLATLDTGLNVKVHNGTDFVDGAKNVSITSVGDINILGSISAASQVSLASTAGSIQMYAGGASIMSNELTLAAAESIGQAFNHISTITGLRINATASAGGIYLTESNRLNIGAITASGADNNISLKSTTGNAYFNAATSAITAVGGTVSIDAGNSITAIAHTHDLITAAAVDLKAVRNIGASANALKIDTGALKTNVTNAGGGAYINNSGNFTSIDVTTNGGAVSLTGAGATNLGYTVSGTNSTLTLANGASTSVAFADSGRNVSFGGINVGSNAFSLTAAAITQTGASRLIAGDVTLVSASQIGQSGGALQTQASSLTLTSGQGGIYVDQAGAVTLNATANGNNSDINIVQAGGDLTLVKAASAKGGVTINSGGSILASAPGATHVTGTSISLTAAGSIGSGSASPLVTRVSAGAGNTGGLTLNANGAIAVENTGAVILDANTNNAGGIYLKNTGDILLNTLNAGAANDIAFTATGKILDNNDPGSAVLNITGNNLALKAASIGASDNAIEMNVRNINVETTNGGLYLEQIGSSDLYVAYVKSTVDASVGTGGDLYLGVVEASKDVTIKAVGNIYENRQGDTRPNVKAATLTLAGNELVGDFVFNVQVLDSDVATGNVSIENLGALHVTQNAITGKSGQTVSIKASSLTVFDNNGGVTVMDNNSSLELIATAGNIVFLNTADTIQTTGTGSITLSALGDKLPDPEDGQLHGTGLVGVIVAGNLVTAGGDINLEAHSHISINILNAGAGDVSVKSNNGLIIDGNGADHNITAKNVYLQGKSLASDQPGLDLTAALSDKDSRATNLAALQRELATAQALVADYADRVAAYTQAYNSASSLVDSTTADLESLQATADALQIAFEAAQTALDAANLAVSVLQIPAGAAQSIPLTGDGGAELALAIASSVINGLTLAVNAADTALGHALDDVSDVQNTLTLYEAYLYADQLNLENATKSLNTQTAILNTTQDSITASEYAYAASQQLLNLVAQKVYDNANATGEGNVIGLKTQALGIQAERVDAYALGQSNIYITSPGGLGAGNINASGVDTTVQLTAEGNLDVLGEINATKDVFLYSKTGAITGTNTGKVTTKDLVAIADDGIGMTAAPINTQVERIAANAGAGGAKFVNDNGVETLTIDEISVNNSEYIGPVTGLNAGGDILVQTTADLYLNKAVVDTTGVSKVTLEAAGGSITGADALTTHVAGGTLFATASTGIGTSTTPLRTDLLAITATNTGAGLINIDEKDAIELTSLHTADGLINVRAGGSIDAISVVSGSDAAANTIDLLATTGTITAHTITAGVTEGVITLTAIDGQVNNDLDTATKITGSTLNISAATGIGVVGTNANTSLDTVISDLNATTTTGDINIAEADDLNVVAVTTGSGNVTIASAAGSLNVTNVTAGAAGNTVTLEAANAITDATADTASNVNASNLALIAGSGIGAAANHFDVTVDNIEALTNTGGIYINDLTGNLTIGGVTPGLGKPALNGITVTTGDIVVTTPGNLVINESIATAAGNVTLDVASGSVTGTTGITHVTGSILTVTASTGIDLVTDIAKITGTNTGAGVINIAEKDAIEITSLVNANGPITVAAGGAIDAVNVVSQTDAAGKDITLTATTGDIIAYTITTGTTQGIVNLTAIAGRVLNDQDTATKITGRDLIISASTGIGNVGANANTSLDTVITNLNATTTTGDINIAEADDLNVVAVTTGNGNVTIASAAGSLNVTNVTASTAGNTVTLEAANAITDATADTASNVNATNLALIAGTGIGADANHFDVIVDNIEALTNTGGIYINDLTGNLTVGGVTPGLGKTALNGITATTGDIEITTPGNLVINESIASAAGNVTLDVSSGNITGTTGVVHVTGSILTVTASTGIDIATNIDKLTATNTGAGAIKIDEKDAIELTSVTAANGPITITAGGTIDAINVVSSTDSDANDITLTATAGNIIAGSITAGPTQGDVILSAAKGSVLNDTNDATVITGNELTITASTGIGEAGNALQTVVDTLYAQVTGAGLINITEQDAIKLADVSAANGSVTITAGGDIDAVKVVSATDTDANDIVITSTGGSITVGEITAGATAGDVTLSAANGQVNNDANTATKITGDVLTITASTGIGAIGTNANTSLDTSVNTLVATTVTGPVNIAEANDLNVQSVTTTDGDVNIISAAGALAVTTISATGAGNTVTLKAATNITDAASDDNANITSANLALIAGTGIGTTSNYFDIAVSNLEASTNTGGIYINNLTNDLTIGGVTPGLGLPALDGLTANEGDIVVNTPGNLTINESVVAPSGSIGLNIGGDLTSNVAITGSSLLITAPGDIIINDALTATDGDVGLDAGGSVTTNAVVSATSGNAIITAQTGTIGINDALTAIDVVLTATSNNGKIDINGPVTATNNVTASSGADIIVNDTVTAVTGSIGMTATDNIVINATIAATEGDVALAATAGSVTGTTGITHVVGNTLDVTAATGLGTSTVAINTEIDKLNTAITGAGLVNIVEKDGLEIGAVTTANGDITIASQTGDIGLGAITASSANNTVTLNAIGGAITDIRDDDTANITADRISLAGAQGVGSLGNDIDVDTSYVTAQGGDGGVYINNLRQGAQLGPIETDTGDISYSTIGSFEVTGTMINNGGGDIYLTTKDSGADTDNLTVNAPIVTVGDGSIYLTADDNLYQNSSLNVASKGAVEATAGNNIIMGDGITTTADLGHITYTAGGTLTLGRLIASTAPVGGTVTITGSIILNNNTTDAALAGAFLNVNTTDDARRGLINDLIANNDISSAIWLNQRLTGGLLSRDATIIGQPRADSAIYHLGWRSLYETGYKRLTIDASIHSDEGFVREATTDTWRFTR